MLTKKLQLPPTTAVEFAEIMKLATQIYKHTKLFSVMVIDGISLFLIRHSFCISSPNLLSVNFDISCPNYFDFVPVGFFLLKFELMSALYLQVSIISHALIFVTRSQFN